MNPFANGSKLTFTYSVGAGFQLKSNDKFTVGLGYEFSYLGKSKMGRSSSQTTSNNFALNHLIIHKIVANLIWDL
jgi:opacity protein-like surface antigen